MAGNDADDVDFPILNGEQALEAFPNQSLGSCSVSKYSVRWQCMLVLWDLERNFSTLEANIALRMPREDTWTISLDMFMQMPGTVQFLVLSLYVFLLHLVFAIVFSIANNASGQCCLVLLETDTISGFSS